MVKRTDIHHVAVYLWKSSVLLSVSESTTLGTLRAQLLPALAPLALHLPVPVPPSVDDLQLWETKEAIDVVAADGDDAAEGEGEKQKKDPGISVVEESDGATVARMGWPRWKTLFVSIRAEDGTFPKPEYTIPDPMDGDDDVDAEAVW